MARERKGDRLTDRQKDRDWEKGENWGGLEETERERETEAEIEEVGRESREKDNPRWMI